MPPILLSSHEVIFLNEQEQVEQALNLLPSDGSEVEFDAYKATLYAANPDGGKATFTRILTNKMVNRRLSLSNGVYTVFLSKKVGA